jgi:hypothetical protein
MISDWDKIGAMVAASGSEVATGSFALAGATLGAFIELAGAVRLASSADADAVARAGADAPGGILKLGLFFDGVLLVGGFGKGDLRAGVSSSTGGPTSSSA